VLVQLEVDAKAQGSCGTIGAERIRPAGRLSLTADRMPLRA